MPPSVIVMVLPETVAPVPLALMALPFKTISALPASYSVSVDAGGFDTVVETI
jgi:hypothetical protein